MAAGRPTAVCANDTETIHPKQNEIAIPKNNFCFIISVLKLQLRNLTHAGAEFATTPAKLVNHFYVNQFFVHHFFVNQFTEESD